MYEEKKDKNVDITYTGSSKATHPGKLGDHPLGGAVGAVAGAAAGSAVVGAIQGAAVGTVAGLPGMAAGVAIGGVVGALAGKGAAQAINPTTEDEYWNQNYKDRDYVERDEPYDTYRTAYRHGVESFTKYEGRRYEDIEPQVRQAWETRSDTTLPWDKAAPASRDAYQRLYGQRNASEVREDDIDTENGER